jgi:hypothetical protein
MTCGSHIVSTSVIASRIMVVMVSGRDRHDLDTSAIETRGHVWGAYVWSGVRIRSACQGWSHSWGAAVRDRSVTHTLSRITRQGWTYHLRYLDFGERYSLNCFESAGGDISGAYDTGHSSGLDTCTICWAAVSVLKVSWSWLNDGTVSRTVCSLKCFAHLGWYVSRVVELHGLGAGSS